MSSAGKIFAMGVVAAFLLTAASCAGGGVGDGTSDDPVPRESTVQTTKDDSAAQPGETSLRTPSGTPSETNSETTPETATAVPSGTASETTPGMDTGTDTDAATGSGTKADTKPAELPTGTTPSTPAVTAEPPVTTAEPVKPVKPAETTAETTNSTGGETTPNGDALQSGGDSDTGFGEFHEITG